MDKLAEIRNQESICRERALSDTDRRSFWLAKAEEWAQRALDEIAFHFREASGRKPSRLGEVHPASSVEVVDRITPVGRYEDFDGVVRVAAYEGAELDV